MNGKVIDNTLYSLKTDTEKNAILKTLCVVTSVIKSSEVDGLVDRFSSDEAKLEALGSLLTKVTGIESKDIAEILYRYSTTETKYSAFTALQPKVNVISTKDIDNIMYRFKDGSDDLKMNVLKFINEKVSGTFTAKNYEDILGRFSDSGKANATKLISDKLPNDLKQKLQGSTAVTRNITNNKITAQNPKGKVCINKTWHNFSDFKVNETKTFEFTATVDVQNMGVLFYDVEATVSLTLRDNGTCDVVYYGITSKGAKRDIKNTFYTNKDAWIIGDNVYQ
ncbi:MAG: hypothetical protein Terrestrivirus4_183 [Terrestrivirus sp.]|uniref:DUF4476 domain-containing protein n=1 Tax=Terrestrivirus sp. TaxID=2487775 RepID=A0A3G4ZMQ6_9VIRU|nr:MAG: hypothetical protein Terrestrivirus4_183 [Terrestrivirus sp.]